MYLPTKNYYYWENEILIVLYHWMCWFLSHVCIIFNIVLMFIKNIFTHWSPIIPVSFDQSSKHSVIRNMTIDDNRCSIELPSNDDVLTLSQYGPLFPCWIPMEHASHDYVSSSDGLQIVSNHFKHLKKNSNPIEYYSNLETLSSLAELEKSWCVFCVVNNTNKYMGIRIKIAECICTYTCVSTDIFHR